MGEGLPTRDAVMGDLRNHLKDSLLLRRKPHQQGGRPVERTDNDDLAEKPVAVVFGTGANAMEFDIYPRPHLEADEWRMAAVNVINSAKPLLVRELETADISQIGMAAENIMDLVNLFIAAHIPAFVELVFLWERSLPKDKILEDLGATDAQLAAAFLVCVKLAFPFFETLNNVSALFQGSATPTAPKETAAKAESPKKT